MGASGENLDELVQFQRDRKVVEWSRLDLLVALTGLIDRPITVVGHPERGRMPTRDIDAETGQRVYTSFILGRILDEDSRPVPLELRGHTLLDVGNSRIEVAARPPESQPQPGSFTSGEASAYSFIFPLEQLVSVTLPEDNEA